MSDEYFCGPDLLAQKVIDYRKSNEQWFSQFQSDSLPLDQQIKDIIRLAYYVSIFPEEGRYPEFRIVFTQSANLNGCIQLTDSWQGYCLEGTSKNSPSDGMMMPSPIRAESDDQNQSVCEPGA